MLKKVVFCLLLIFTSVSCSSEPTNSNNDVSTGGDGSGGDHTTQQFINALKRLNVYTGNGSTVNIDDQGTISSDGLYIPYTLETVYSPTKALYRYRLDSSINNVLITNTVYVKLEIIEEEIWMYSVTNTSMAINYRNALYFSKNQEEYDRYYQQANDPKHIYESYPYKQFFKQNTSLDQSENTRDTFFNSLPNTVTKKDITLYLSSGIRYERYDTNNIAVTISKFNHTISYLNHGTAVILKYYGMNNDEAIFRLGSTSYFYAFKKFQDNNLYYGPRGNSSAPSFKNRSLNPFSYN